MIKLRLELKKNPSDKTIEIVTDELLSSAVDRTLEGVPLGDFSQEEVFNVSVNGHMIEKDFWSLTKLSETDSVIISPKIGKGDSGQFFKQIAIVVIAVAASAAFGPGGGYAVGSAFGAGLATAAVTIAATLLLNALIPPPVPNIGGVGGAGGVDDSQMYAITGQANQMKRLGTVPKVYGTHRMFPNLAVTPYTELAVSRGTKSAVSYQDVRYTSKNLGTLYNTITITYTSGGTAGSEVVTVVGKAISVKIESGVSTADQIISKITASTAASALVSANRVAAGSETQLVTGVVDTLSGGTNAGETIQYLYAIYDFGMGTSTVTDLKIGDTPLTTDSFLDFEYNFVDPLSPTTPADVYDEFLKQDFSNYRNKRVATPLSIDFVNGSETIQFADNNSDTLPQEILLDFICPRGLFGYSSNGVTGERNIGLNVHFALVGTEDWRAYNDTDYVDSYSAVGGDDLTDFESELAIFGTSSSAYYDTVYQESSGSYGFNNTNNNISTMRIKPGQNKLLVPDNSDFIVGAKVFKGGTLLGKISSINNIAGPNTELLLDRNIPTYPVFSGYKYTSTITYGGSENITNIAYDAAKIVTSRHGDAAAVIRGERQTPVYSHFRFTPKVTGQYKVRVRRVSTYGTFTTQVGDALTWVGITTAYQQPPINSKKRHVFLELKIRATDQLNGNIQNLSGIVTSVIPVYDPNTQTWTRGATNSPAWVFCDLLTGEVNKKPLAQSQLDMDSIVAWDEYCGEVPTPPPSATYLEPRFQCNFILDYATSLSGVIAQVCGAAQASINLVDGKHGVLVDRLVSVPVQIFTPRNSNNFAASRIYGPKPHALKVRYIDPQLNWEVGESVVYDNGYTELNATEFDELSSFACTNHEQAWRFGRYMIAQNKLRVETISLDVDFEHLACSRGDYVQITQDAMRVGGTPARVKAVSGVTITVDDSLDIDPLESYGYVYRNSATGAIVTSTLTVLTASTFDVDGTVPAVGDLIVIGIVGEIVYDCIIKSISPNDDLSANLVLVEKVDAIFEYESTDTLPDYDPQISTSSSPDFKPPRAVIGLAATDNDWECSVTKSGYNYFVELVWDIPAGSVYEFFEIWVNDGRGYRSYDTTTDKIYRYDVEQSRLNIQYGFKVVAVSASGKKLQVNQMPEVLVIPTSKTEPPSDVEVLDMSITNQVVQLSWKKVVDCDVASYDIRYSPGLNDAWEASIPLATVARDVNNTAVQARTGVYLIKAVDFAGNQSENAARSVTTVPDLFELNIIDSVNDAPNFGGTKDRVVLLGDAVVLDQEIVSPDPDFGKYYSSGYYSAINLLDVGDVYTVRLQSQIRADGYKLGELMSDWLSLDTVDHLNTSESSDWEVGVEYRATDVFSAMADWVQLQLVDNINAGAGIGYTDWRPIPTIGDATGRIFQFRARLTSNFANVTPRLFDSTVQADMPDRIDSFENLVSSASDALVVTYISVFNGPGTTPNVQISIDNAQTGDYWTFGYKSLAGLSIRFYDKTDTQVVRQFDLVAKGYGRRATTTI